MPSTAVFNYEPGMIQGKQHWGADHERAVVGNRETQRAKSEVLLYSSCLGFTHFPLL